VAAARAAGMRAFAYVGGMVAPESLAGPGTILFDDMRRLPALIADLVAS
jgi:beta-phosphoglucomutase-like phosphatase (HAD superfamily)